MDLFSSYSSNTQSFAHISLRRYDIFLYRSKAYRDSVISDNILRKATQLVAQIENAKWNAPGASLAGTMDDIISRRGRMLDTQS
ncbi:MAG: hypothetical protein LRY54_01175 [Alphaproteobacteria bacterium]|nr:hypothetical protein [Alphaproteobacteria bacterium]